MSDRESRTEEGGEKTLGFFCDPLGLDYKPSSAAAVCLRRNDAACPSFSVPTVYLLFGTN